MFGIRKDQNHEMFCERQKYWFEMELKIASNDTKNILQLIENSVTNISYTDHKGKRNPYLFE